MAVRKHKSANNKTRLIKYLYSRIQSRSRKNLPINQLATIANQLAFRSQAVHTTMLNYYAKRRQS